MTPFKLRLKQKAAAAGRPRKKTKKKTNDAQQEKQLPLKKSEAALGPNWMVDFALKVQKITTLKVILVAKRYIT